MVPPLYLDPAALAGSQPPRSRVDPTVASIVAAIPRRYSPATPAGLRFDNSRSMTRFFAVCDTHAAAVRGGAQDPDLAAGVLDHRERISVSRST